MDPELEVAAAASIGGLAAWRARHGAKPGTPCANCGTPLGGPYCHACGQLAESFDRSIWSLAKEAVENFFDADGRVFHTVPRLILRPAALTRDYLAGRRAAQTPPLRLFLVVIVLFFFAGGLKGQSNVPPTLYRADSPGADAFHLTADARPAAKAVIAWLNPRLNYAAKHPREFVSAVEGWMHRIAIMLLPVAALLLGLLFVFNRRFFLFDHAIFAMHSLSFMGLLFTVTTLLGMATSLQGIAGLLGWGAPVHLFVHMRGVYRTSIFGTLMRMLLLFILTSISVVLLVAGVVAIELSGLGDARP